MGVETHATSAAVEDGVAREPGADSRVGAVAWLLASNKTCCIKYSAGLRGCYENSNTYVAHVRSPEVSIKVHINRDQGGD